MKKTLLFSLAAVLILCVGIYIGTTFNNQKNTSDSTPQKEVAPEEIEYIDNKVVSDDSTQSIEHMTQEDKAWLFQQVYDGMHTTMQDSDEDYLFAELSELPSFANTASKHFFDNRKAPDTLEDEYKAWRAEKYGKKETNNSTTSKTETTNKVTETQKPAQTQNQQKPAQSQSQNQQKPAQSNSGQSNAGEVMTTNPFADQDRTRTPEQLQKDIEDSLKEIENSTGKMFAGSGK